MLVSSYPSSSNTWYATGKDEVKSDPSSITVYAIGIKNILFANVGYLQVGFTTLTNSAYAGSTSAAVTTVPTGWALTCCGGISVYNGNGRILNGMWPIQVNQAEAYSKDLCALTDNGTITAYAVRVQKAP